MMLQYYPHLTGTRPRSLASAQILSWKANSIRIPLNSICWLNPATQLVQTQYGGANYQAAIKVRRPLVSIYMI